MDTDTYFKDVYRKLERDSFEFQTGTIGSFSATVAYKSQFEPALMATQLNFVAVMGTGPKITGEDFKDFTGKAFDYALQNYKGLPRGLQSGVAVFAFLVSDDIDDAAKWHALKAPEKHFAAMEMPVILDLSEGNLYYYDKTPVWGMIYYKAIRRFIETYFRPDAGQ